MNNQQYVKSVALAAGILALVLTFNVWAVFVSSIVGGLIARLQRGMSLL